MRQRLAFLAGIVWLIVGYAGPSAADANPKPLDDAETWARLAGDTSGAIVYRWNKGLAYAMPKDAQSQPLFGLEGLTIAQFRKLPEGGYEERSLACGIYYDATTGDYLREFDNPFTGKRVPLKPHCGLIGGARYTDKGIALIAGFEIESTALGKPDLLQWSIIGDRAVIRRDAHTRWVEPRSGNEKHEITAETYVASFAALTDPQTTSVDAFYSWVSQTEWLTALEMGESPGNLLWVLQGQKFRTVDELPAKFRDAFEQAFPGKLEKPF